MKGRVRALTALLLATCAQACGPRIPIPPGAAVSTLILTSTGNQTRFDRLILDERSYSPSLFSFTLPAGHHTVEVTFTTTTSDWCHSGDQGCTITTLIGECSGAFRAEPHGSYRILVDTRSGSLQGTVQKRSDSAVFLGQDEAILERLACKKTGQREQRAPEGLISF
jgi:hypothetical protein